MTHQSRDRIAALSGYLRKVLRAKSAGAVMEALRPLAATVWAPTAGKLEFELVGSPIASALSHRGDRMSGSRPRRNPRLYLFPMSIDGGRWADGPLSGWAEGPRDRRNADHVRAVACPAFGRDGDSGRLCRSWARRRDQ